MQNIIYLSLQNSKIVLLRNSTEELFTELKKNIEKSFLLREKIKKINKRKASDWTEEEIEYLKHNFYDIDIDLLSLHLKKSQYQISLKAIEMKLVGAREWSSREIEYLEKNVDLPIEQIGNNEYKGGNNEIGNYAFLSAHISTEDKYENIRKYDESIYIGELKNDTSDVIEVKSKSIRNLKNDDVEKYIKKIKGEESNE